MPEQDASPGPPAPTAQSADRGVTAAAPLPWLSATRAATRAAVRAHWPLLAVLGAFIASMFVVPTLAPVAISDDWVYIRSVEILVREHRLYVLPIATAHLVFQIAWAALFSSVFGLSIGVIRLSVVVLWFLSGIACYALIWELTRHRALSALGAFVYLFNPLGYALAFTFMTDAPFTSLLVISTYASVRGLRGPTVSLNWLLIGSAVAAAGVLVRQPGLLIPMGVLTGLWLGGRLRFDRQGASIVTQVAALPFAAYIAYYFWLTRINGVPFTQTLMRDELLEGGVAGLSAHAEQMFIIEMTYIGMFLLPVVAAAAPAIVRVVRGLSFRGWVVFGIWQLAILAGFAGLWATSHVMPYVPHFFSRAGLGPNDLVVGRWPIADAWVFVTLTMVATVAAIGVGLLLIRALHAPRGERAGVTLVLGALAWQGAGALVVSTHFRNWSLDGISAPSLDRYLLPLLPLALAAGIWAIRDLRPSLRAGWWVALVLGAFAVASTRDNLVYHQAIWSLARTANADGIPNLRLDAGGAWDGYYVGEYSLAQENPIGLSNPRWWISLFAPAIDPEYSISSWPLHGHTTLRTYPYPLWLDPTAELYLVRRDEPPRP